MAGLLGGWLPWQAQLGHRLSQGCQPAPGGGPPAQLGGWEGSRKSTDFNSCPNWRPQQIFFGNFRQHFERLLTNIINSSNFIFYVRPQSVDNVDKLLMQKWCIGANTLVQQNVC